MPTEWPSGMTAMETANSLLNLLRIAGDDFQDLAPRFSGRDVDDRDRLALLVVARTRVIGHLFPIDTGGVGLDAPSAVQDAAVSGLVQRIAVGSVIDDPL